MCVYVCVVREIWKENDKNEYIDKQRERERDVREMWRLGRKRVRERSERERKK